VEAVTEWRRCVEGRGLLLLAEVAEVADPRGVLTRDFEPLNLEFQLQEERRKLKGDAGFGSGNMHMHLVQKLGIARSCLQCGSAA
jgi:hypothetical protein